MKTSEIIAIKIKELRKNHNLTQKEISEKLNIAQTTYAGYETGKHEPNTETLLKIAELFNCSVDYLIGRYK